MSRILAAVLHGPDHRTYRLKLRVHTIIKGRYILAGEEIPDEEVPPGIAKYAVSEDGDAADMPELEPPPAPKRQLKAVKRARR